MASAGTTPGHESANCGIRAVSRSSCASTVATLASRPDRVDRGVPSLLLVRARDGNVRVGAVLPTPRDAKRVGCGNGRQHSGTAVRLDRRTARASRPVSAPASASDPEAPSLRVTSGRRSPTLLRRVFIRVGQGHRFPKWQRRHRVGSLEWIGNDYSCSLRWSWLWSPFSPPGDVMTGALSRRTPKRRYPEPTVGFRRAPPVCATT